MHKVLRVMAAVIAALVLLGMGQVSMSSTIRVDTEIADPDPPTGG